MRKRKWIFSSLLVALLAAVVVGCQSVGYYKQAFSGQWQMLSNQQPIKGLIEDPGTSSKLKEKFRLILALREFAEKHLNLPAGDHYLSYIDLHRSNAVWNVYATPEFSIKPKSWWFPVVGNVTYRGYFSERAAENYAEKLRKKGFDVYVGGVDAYSTLGWFNDPVLNTFIEDSDRRLAGLIFHELTHQRVFISGDTEFNEAFATAVAEEGLRRWLVENGDSAGLEKYQAELKRKKQFVDLIQSTRDRLQSIYDNADLSDSVKREQKGLVFRQLQENYAKLKTEWGGHSGYDEWFADTVNNAKLNTVATYYDLVPAFHQLIQNNNGDLKKFFVEMKHFAKMCKDKRHQTLAALKINGEDPFFAAPDFPTQAASLPK